MTSKSLGRGLSAFLDFNKQASENRESSIINIGIDSIKENPYQPRQTFDEKSLNFLAESIKRNGVLQPIIVLKLEDENYQLIAGERRLRASKIAGISEIPAVAMSDIGREDQLEIAILENIQRENLNPLEEAAGYKKLIDEFNHTQEELSGILGKSRSHISNMLRILSLPNEIKAMVSEGKLTFGHARAILGADNSISMASQIVDQSLNVRQAENLVKSYKGNNSKDNYVNPDVINLANQISSIIGLNSNIKLKRNGGVVEINFSNFEELDSLIQKLNH